MQASQPATATQLRRVNEAGRAGLKVGTSQVPPMVEAGAASRNSQEWACRATYMRPLSQQTMG